MRNKFLIKQKSKKNLISLSLIISLFLLIFLTTSVVSAYARQNVAYNPNTVSYIGTNGFPLFDRSMCGAGQDFILQISPIGCTPSVVRSDLLEDQNVPVFCPIMATQLNPLIDIEAIKTMTIRLNGSSPYIQGISYLPARAALGEYRPQINTPILNNFGYAVIILKKQKNQSNIPDIVTGDLVARIKYDIKNAFGVGQANFYLPELNDDEWGESFTQYSFWDGRGYLRAEGIDEDSVSVSIYSDRDQYGSGKSGEKRKLSSAILRLGKDSPEMPMPGFDYCMGSMRLRLNKLESPDTRVKLMINGDVVEVKKNEKFLENKCQVREIDKQGFVENIKITCDTDEGRKPFSLTISPKIILDIDGVLGEYGIGEKLPFSDDPKKKVYVGYISTKKDTGKEEDLYARFVQTPLDADKLSQSILLEVAILDDSDRKDGTGSLLRKGFNLVLKVGEDVVKGVVRIGTYIVGGNEFTGVINLEETKEVFGTKISIVGFAEPRDIELSGEINDYYEKAIENYDDAIYGFSSEKYPSDDVKTLGEKALFKKIELAHMVNQKRTVVESCEEFRENYPNSIIPPLCNEISKLSNSGRTIQDVQINGKIERISFEKIKEPTSDEYGAEIIISNAGECSGKWTLGKEQETCFSDSEVIKLIKLTNEYAEFDVSSVKESTSREIFWKTNNFRLELGKSDVIGKNNYQITVTKINLKKLAKVSVIPTVKYSETTAGFSFKLGIEKRGIQLSPEKTTEKIESLNQTISKWENRNEKLGKVVTGFKTACLGVGATLTVKNFFENLEGKGIARNMVMRGDGGWFEICENKVSAKEYTNINSCLLDKSDEINVAVDAYASAMEVQNKESKELRARLVQKSFLGEDILDTEKYLEEYVDSKFKNELDSNLAGINTIRVGNKDVLVSDITPSINSNTVSLTQAKNLQLNSRLLSSSDENVRNIALSQIKSDLGDIWVNNENEIQKQDTIELVSQIGLSGIGVDNYLREKSKEGTYDGWKIPSGGVGQIPEGVNAKAIIYGGQVYILQLEEVGDKNYRVVEIYDTNKVKLNPEEPIYKEIQSSFSFKQYDKTTYENEYKNAEIKYYETAPYKGLPALVPFDIKKGWYAAIRSTLPIGGNIKAYDDSGRISSFWLCNVGYDEKEEFNSGIGDDICEMINLGTGQPYNQFPGLESGKASQLIKRAVSAIEVASRAYKSGVSRVSIEGHSFDVGKPAINIPDIECQDFMSPSDCNLLFNVCDPVICPSSRCDLGGTYPVKDVVQSGIIGGLALCLPNFPEVKVPVCLSGVHAGVENYLTVLDSYQECLQTSLDTGQTVGICDEIYSVHMCEFFWRQALPLAKITIPKIIGAVLGQNVRGGGEYLGVQDAWQKASDSVNYFTQYYAANSFKAFKARTAEGVGTEVCKNFISLTTPQGNLLDALVAPDSPSQFYGRFDEIPFTTATNPPISHYKVFYHIYAGKDYPAYFQVYLHGEGSSFFQDTRLRRIVAQGFIKAGDYETQTLDFTAPSGYSEMCIIVNGQEECGFKQVTTDFGVNYITEQYVASQASQTDIKTEAACISGTPSMYSLLSPNLQAGVEEIINPAIYNRGITRICATDDPGKATDYAAGTETARWQPVGDCGNDKIICWLDTNSVKDTIKSTNIEGKVIEDVSQNYVDTLKKEYGYIEDFEALVEEIELETSEKQIEKINENYDKVFYNSEKGYLTLLRGNAYSWLAFMEKYLEELKMPEPEIGLVGDTAGDVIVGEGEEGETGGEAGGETEENICLTNEECQKYLGERIIDLAKAKKGTINDNDVKADTGAESFECLILQVAVTESSIRHCKQYKDSNGNPLYCDGNRGELIGGDSGNSLGIMQINTLVHSNVAVENFEENVNYGINLLINGHFSIPKGYDCNGKTYQGWARALRSYNGWNTDCSKGNINYVEKVISYKNDIGDLFPECAIGTEPIVGNSPPESEFWEAFKVGISNAVSFRVGHIDYEEADVWGDIILRTMRVDLDIGLDSQYVSLVISTIERESDFREDPLTPNIEDIIQRKLQEIEEEGGLFGIKSYGANRFYEKYKDQIREIKTERQLEQFLDSVGFLEKPFVKVFRPETVGSMQLNVEKARALAEKYGNKDYSEKEMRSILYTRDGGVYYGMLYLNEIINTHMDLDREYFDEEKVKLIAADYQSGLYSSRNAALQEQLNFLTGSNLALDGDIGPKTMEVVEEFLIEMGREDLSNSRNLKSFQAIEKEKRLETTNIYQIIKTKYEQETGNLPKYAIIPETVLDSAKFGSEITSERYVEGTYARYRAYCSLLGCI